MVLKQFTAKKHNNIVKTILSNSTIQTYNFNFKNEKILELKKPNVLHVFQREFATILPNQFEFIGSSEATTCIILFIRNKKTGKINCSHIDGSKNQIGGNNCSLKKIFSTFNLEESSGVLELNFIGGYYDGSENSDKLIDSILFELENSNLNFEIKTFFVSTENSILDKKDSIYYPIAKHASMETSTGKVFQTNFQVTNPEEELRSLRWLGDSELGNIYDYKNEVLKIENFHYQTIEQANLFLKLPDKVLLEYMSTSPEVESENFIPKLKNSLKFLINNPDAKIFFGNESICYKIQDGNWKRI
eukprot:gene7108-11271_t